MNESALKPEKVEARDSREVILAVALKLFTTKGYDGASIDDIRMLAGFKSKASLYTHFRSKEELAQALMSRILEQIELIFNTSREGADQALMQFITVVRGLVEWSNSHPQECIFHMIQRQKQLMSNWESEDKELSTVELMFLEMVQQLRVHYPVRPVASPVLLNMVFVIVAQAVLNGRAFGDISFDEKVEQIVSMCFGVMFSESVPVSKSELANYMV
jgi:AcrR family transcriptional regulator